ncbi:MAG: hypothetical protein V9F00_11130 [Nocardioides sp.]
MFERVDGDVPLQEGDGGFVLPQLLAQARVLLTQMLDLLFEPGYRFGVLAVAVDAGTELFL